MVTLCLKVNRPLFSLPLPLESGGGGGGGSISAAILCSGGGGSEWNIPREANMHLACTLAIKTSSYDLFYMRSHLRNMTWTSVTMSD